MKSFITQLAGTCKSWYEVTPSVVMSAHSNNKYLSSKNTGADVDAAGGCNLQCWKCNNLVCKKNIFCSSCHAIQPVREKDDFFAYLGLNKDFVIDETELRNRFRKLQSEVHPDKHAQNTQDEQKFSEEHSSFLNVAYKTLLDPVSRANYLLRIDEENEESRTNQEFAMEMMELNEEIEATSSKEKLKEKLAQMDVALDELLANMRDAFSKKRFNEAKECINRMRYLRRTKELIEEKLDGLHRDE